MKNLSAFLVSFLALAAGCRPAVSEEYPDVYPDYVGVTVPECMAQLRFMMSDGSACRVRTRAEADTVWYSVTSCGVRYREFPVCISHDSIDPYIAYRLIEPGYESWHDISLCQRELSSWSETPIVTNRENNMGCINCHNFQGGSPERFFFHARGKGGGTVFVNGDELKLLNLASAGPGKQGTYPAWHPGGRYVAFSSNTTHQCFTIGSTQPLEVYDTASDIILMDLLTDSVTTYGPLCGAERMETFPCWSSDGETLYYCAADSMENVAVNRGEIHYGLMAVDFRDGEFCGEPRVIWQDPCASASFPRVNGDWILFTRSDYGTFPIWHKEADLWLLNIVSGENFPAAELNSDDTESYHSWSSNGKWLVFSSRRDDGRYTRLYFSHFDGDGHFTKPFMLSQRRPEMNALRLKSYNVPEFICGKVADRRKELKALFE